MQTVFDAAPQYGSDKYIWQVHSSSDDRVHSATLRSSATYEMLGCLAYREDTKQFSYFPKNGDFDECQIDKSGRWLVIKENVDGLYGEDNLIIDLQTGTQTVLLDQNGAAGHSDNGYGYMVYSDKLIEGSPKNSTSSVPIMPWGAADTDVQKCGEFIQ